MNPEPMSNESQDHSAGEAIKILFLTLNPDLQGPIPKLAPMLIAQLEKAGFQVTRSSWGRHSDRETVLQKIFSRFADIGAMVKKLVTLKPAILYIDTTLDEVALIRDFPLMVAASGFSVKKVIKIHGSKTSLLIEPGHWIYKAITRFIIRRSDAILILSHEGLQKWQSFEPRGNYYRVDNPYIPEFRPETTRIETAVCRQIDRAQRHN
jgi:hypothetical protein